jgi:hypothetical protein
LPKWDSARLQRESSRPLPRAAETTAARAADRAPSATAGAAAWHSEDLTPTRRPRERDCSPRLGEPWAVLATRSGGTRTKRTNPLPCGGRGRAEWASLIISYQESPWAFKGEWPEMTTTVAVGLVRCSDCVHARVKPGTNGREWRCEAPTRELVGGRVYRSDGKTLHWCLTRPRRCFSFEGHV